MAFINIDEMIEFVKSNPARDPIRISYNLTNKKVPGAARQIRITIAKAICDKLEWKDRDKLIFYYDDVTENLMIRKAFENEKSRRRLHGEDSAGTKYTVFQYEPGMPFAQEIVKVYDYVIALVCDDKIYKTLTFDPKPRESKQGSILTDPDFNVAEGYRKEDNATHELPNLTDPATKPQKDKPTGER